VGLPTNSETMQSLTFKRAKELVAGYHIPETSAAWKVQRERIMSRLNEDIFGGFPDPAQCKRKLVRKLTYKGYPAEQWTLEPEPGVIVPAVLMLPVEGRAKSKRP